jgi:hypothetical protein
VGDAERICAAAKSNAPVDIGALRDSGHVEKASGTASAEFDIVLTLPSRMARAPMHATWKRGHRDGGTTLLTPCNISGERLDKN